MRDFKKFVKGVRLKDNNDGPNAIGDISGSLTTEDHGALYNYQNRIKAFLDSAEREVTTNDQTQTLENKTIDGTAASGNNTITADADNITYDDTTNVLYTFGTDVQSALDAVKTQLDAQNEASEIDYDNSTSGLTATDVQAAIDEVEGRLDGSETDVADLQTLSGEAANSTDHGTFTGTTIQDGRTTHEALQDLETAYEETDQNVDDLITLSGEAENATDHGTFTGTTIADNRTTHEALQDLETGLEDHEALTSGVHGVTGNVVGTTNTQTLTNKTLTTPVIDEINTSTDTDLNLNPNGTGKVVASAELDLSSTIEQSEADNAVATGTDADLTLPATGIVRLTDGSLSSISSIAAGAAGQELILENATGSLITINDEDTGATAANRIKTGTKASITLADEASISLFYDSTESRWMVNGGVGGESSAGSVDIYYQEKFEVTSSSDVSTGNDAAPLGGGSLAGSVADETASPIEGAQSLSYTQASGSVDDYVALPDVSVGIQQKDKSNKLVAYVNYDGDDDDIQLGIYDQTNSIRLGTVAIKASSTSRRYEVPFSLADSTSTINVYLQTLVENNGAKLIIDLVQLDCNPQQSVAINPENTVSARIENNGVVSINSENGDFIDSVVRNSAGRVQINFKAGYFTETPSINATCENAALGFNISLLGLSNTTVEVLTFNAGETVGVDQNFTIIVQKQGIDYVDPFDAFIQFQEQSYESFTPVIQGFGTVSNLQALYMDDGRNLNMVVKFTAGTVSATEARVGLPPDYTVLSDITSISSVGMAAVAATSGASNRVEALVLGDNDYVNFRAFTGQAISAANASTFQGSGQDFAFFAKVPINQGTSQELVVPAIRTMLVKDVKVSGTNGGSSVGGAYATRDLNTIEGDRFGTLSSNQFTLPPGKYYLYAESEIFASGSSNIRLQNITDATTIETGKNTYSVSGSITNVNSLMATFEITETKTFEIQYLCNASQATNGLGRANSFGASDELFTQVKIDKIL